METPCPLVNILGVHVSAINVACALESIDQWVRTRDQHYVCVTGVHGVMESQRDERLKKIHNQAGLVTPDGMPLVWLGRWKGFSEIERVYGPDLMLAVCQQSLSKNYRHFFFCGDCGVVDKLTKRLGARFPGICLVGSYSPPFRPVTDAEDEAIVRHINAANPDIVWVGLSTPKQEYWMHQHIDRIRAPVMVGVGAAFDFLSGVKKQAPRWMQRSGLEWGFRLMSEPRRLWRRYLQNNPMFVLLILRDALRRRLAI